MALLVVALLTPTCSAYWPTLQGNSARQGRLSYPYIRTPPPSDSFRKWSANLSSPDYLDLDLPPYTFGTPAVDSNGTVYATYATSVAPLYSGIVAIFPDGTKRWILGLDTSTGLVAKGSVTLSEDEKLLYVVASNSVAKAVFYALYTDSGTEAWRYTASFSLQGISEPVVYESAVVMGDSRQLYYFADGTRPQLTWKYNYYIQANNTENVYRVAPSISLYNADIIFTCERKYILSLFIDDATLKWVTPLTCNNTLGCDMTGNAASIGDDGTIFVPALDKYNVTTLLVNETTNETTTIDTPHSDFYLFTINAGGRVRHRLKLSSTTEGIGMWQIPAVSVNSQYVYVGGYQPEANLWRVNIQLQNFTSVLQLNGNASSPPIATAGGRGYVVDSTSDLYAYNAVDAIDSWTTPFGDQHYYSSMAFGEDGTIFISDSTSGGLFAYGCPTGTQVGSSGACVPCPAGTYFVTDGRALCPQCPKGKVSDGGGDVSSCQFCPSDSIPSADQTKCVECPAGSQPSFDLTSCTASTPATTSGSAHRSRSALSLFFSSAFFSA